MEEKHQQKDKSWMRKALVEAQRAMEEGELPIASILVGGDTELTRGQTQTARRESIAAHGELFALLDAKSAVWVADRPLTIYTTLEPCLMCIGAAMQCQVDRIVYGMPAEPDGGARFVPDIIERGMQVPSVEGGVCGDEAIELMDKFVKNTESHPGLEYAEALVDGAR